MVGPIIVYLRAAPDTRGVLLWYEASFNRYRVATLSVQSITQSNCDTNWRAFDESNEILNPKTSTLNGFRMDLNYK